MMNNLNSQQLAELLARKCANDIDTFVMNAPHTKNQEEALLLLSERILQSIPLVELLTCSKELEELAQDLSINTTALTDLRIKLTQILEGETKE